jgi:hypothetical protein
MDDMVQYLGTAFWEKIKIKQILERWMDVLI